MKPPPAIFARTVVFLAVVALLGSTRDALAQLKGNSIPGFTGMENGSQRRIEKTCPRASDPKASMSAWTTAPR
jgi:hypothetical protein